MLRLGSLYRGAAASATPKLTSTWKRLVTDGVATEPGKEDQPFTFDGDKTLYFNGSDFLGSVTTLVKLK